MGLLRLGALVRYVPVSIVIGFTNGIAVLIGLSQVKDFLGLDTPRLPADFFALIGALATHVGTVNPAAVAVAAGSLVIVAAWPKSYAMPVGPLGTTGRLRRWAAHLPGTVVALVLSTLAVVLLHLPVETIGSRFGAIPQTLPALALPEFNWSTVKQLLIPTLTIALLGAIESLLCARVADQMADVPRHDPNQELMAQGIANVVVPLAGGIPATGTIARTVTNVRSGGRTPLAGMVHALTLLAVMLLAAPLALHVPLAALAGILMFVAWNMGEWREFARLRQFNLPYRVILLGTFALTVVFDLTVAVEVGLVLACAFFIYRMGTLFRVQPMAPAGPQPAGVQVFELVGSLFFGAVGKVEALADQVGPASRTVVLGMHRMLLLDTSGLDALEQLHRELGRRGVALMLADVGEQPLSLIRRSGFADRLGPGRIVATVAAALAEPAQR
jgi:SulP family sulfate permease